MPVAHNKKIGGDNQVKNIPQLEKRWQLAPCPKTPLVVEAFDWEKRVKCCNGEGILSYL